MPLGRGTVLRALLACLINAVFGVEVVENGVKLPVLESRDADARQGRVEFLEHSVS